MALLTTKTHRIFEALVVDGKRAGKSIPDSRQPRRASLQTPSRKQLAEHQGTTSKSSTCPVTARNSIRTSDNADLKHAISTRVPVRTKSEAARRSNRPPGFHQSPSTREILPFPGSSRQIRSMKTSSCRINKGPASEGAKASSIHVPHRLARRTVEKRLDKSHVDPRGHRRGRFPYGSTTDPRAIASFRRPRRVICSPSAVFAAPRSPRQPFDLSPAKSAVTSFVHASYTKARTVFALLSRFFS